MAYSRVTTECVSSVHSGDVGVPGCHHGQAVVRGNRDNAVQGGADATGLEHLLEGLALVPAHAGVHAQTHGLLGAAQAVDGRVVPSCRERK